jgi:hypothetical protein
MLAGEQPGWEEQKIEEVQGRAQLPVLVLQSQGGDLPLHLRDSEQTPAHTVLLEQALVCVQVLEGGAQHYHVLFRLRQASADRIDVELPAPVALLNLSAWLGRKQISYAVINDTGLQADDGRIARLGNIGPLMQAGSLLELQYQVPPSLAGSSPLRTVLRPPLLRGSPAAMPLRWLVSAPPGWVLLAPENSSDVERAWRRSGWLLTPRLTPGADDLALLQRAGAAEAFSSPSLMCWRDSGEPLTVFQASQHAWLLVCSLGLLVLGLGLFWPTRRPAGRPAILSGWVFPVVALAGLVLAVLSLVWPTAISAVVYGCEPGAVVLLFAVAVQWLVHERYRRQVVFLPSFSRGQPGSSLLRGTSQRPHGEPSTVDAPQPILGSSSGPPRGSGQP